jgi:hypothetical protein
VAVATGATAFWDRRFHQKMKSPSRIAKATMGIVTPIAIFAPVERPGDGGVGEVVELVLDAVAGLLGDVAGDKVRVDVVGKDRVGVKSSKISVSVLCHRT